jgi:hypothetical protein
MPEAEDYFVFARSLNIVIPGRDEVASPQSISTSRGYGFPGSSLSDAPE